jgi:anti-sigma regulatory factor (Ser/Thr protein kinase)
VSRPPHIASLPVTGSFRAHPSALFEIREFIRERAAESSFSGSTGEDLVTAVSEACANSIIHTSTSKIRVVWRSIDGCVQVVIHDDGVFRRRIRMPEIEGSGGHGIPLMMALVDEFSIKEGTRRHPGTSVKLVKCKGR